MITIYVADCRVRIYLSWIFPFRCKRLFFGVYRLFMDGIFNISELPVLIAEALPGEKIGRASCRERVSFAV